jgi:hypothetical protein
MAFFMCILQYVLEMIVLIAIGLLGGSIGIKLRRRKDAKVAAEQAVTTKE